MKFLTIAAKCTAAGLLMLLGTAFLVLPGPGFPLIIAGVAMLATEFAWAASLQARMLTWLRNMLRVPAAVLARLREKPQPMPCTSGGCE